MSPITRSATRQKPSCLSFLSLPAEIRLEIYRYLLVRDYIAPWGFKSSDEPGDGSDGRHPEILRLCHLVHHEAASVLYGENLFDWVKLICLDEAGNRRLVRHVFTFPGYFVFHERGDRFSSNHISDLVAGRRLQSIRTLTFGAYDLGNTDATEFAVYMGITAGKHFNVVVVGTAAPPAQSDLNQTLTFPQHHTGGGQYPPEEIALETVIIRTGRLRNSQYDFLTSFDKDGWGFTISREKRFLLRGKWYKKFKLTWGSWGTKAINSPPRD